MKGKLIIFSAPSGAGKTSIVKELLKKIPELEFSVSACSRPMRPTEINGKDYYFISAEEFRQKIKEEQFVEWEEVYPGSYYGTLKSELERIWDKGHHVVFDVDVIGGLNIKEQYPQEALSIFIKPPSIEELKRRLENRQTETLETLQKRIDKAEYELGFADKFDVRIINNVLEEAINEANSKVKAFIRS
ncbi:MAG: guanylate kinase [Bacteroidetes bacterium]|nr:guanylate kinase [Bacteroidota bacterium]